MYLDHTIAGSNLSTLHADAFAHVVDTVKKVWPLMLINELTHRTKYYLRDQSTALQ